MNESAFISLYLDTRRAKANGKFPVKLRVFTNTPRKQLLYATKFELSKTEFQSTWETAKPRHDEFKEIRQEMLALELRANKIASKLSPFTFEVFERQFIRKHSDSKNIVWYYHQAIKRLHSEKRFGSESSYYLSLKSLLGYKCKLKNKKLDFPKLAGFRADAGTFDLGFYEVTPKWLSGYEGYLTGELELSFTTVGIYLRALRAILNQAIEEKDMDKEIYPFGKRKYVIPAGGGVKKALNMEQIPKLFYAQPQNAEQEKAKAFWFFSFACNGMNMKDIALLRFSNVDGDRISFYREKTKTTTKAKLKPIEAYLTDKPKEVIKKYGNKNTGPKQFVFPILSDSQTDFEQFRAVKNFTKFVNQHLKLLAESVGITTNISTYWARHSFSTNTIRMGKSLEYVGESLGHGSPNTTKAYFAGFEDEDKKEFMKTLMDF